MKIIELPIHENLIIDLGPLGIVKVMFVGKTQDGHVKLSFEAPPAVAIDRAEVRRRKNTAPAFRRKRR
jgi:sRNA-binding carbon storage regulator CsrA